ncbi:sigma-70 family RNA polymerase sigma factor [Kribbella swartbergensis]
MITNTAIGWWRRTSWWAERPNDDVPDRAVDTDDATVRIWLWHELQRLPPRQRAALVLRYYEDLTEVQTAEVLGCSVGTVKSQVSDALKKLRSRLGADAVAPAFSSFTFSATPPRTTPFAVPAGSPIYDLFS